jgi:hypothetical protein
LILENQFFKVEAKYFVYESCRKTEATAEKSGFFFQKNGQIDGRVATFGYIYQEQNVR